MSGRVCVCSSLVAAWCAGGGRHTPANLNEEWASGNGRRNEAHGETKPEATRDSGPGPTLAHGMGTDDDIGRTACCAIRRTERERRRG